MKTRNFQIFSLAVIAFISTVFGVSRVMAGSGGNQPIFLVMQKPDKPGGPNPINFGVIHTKPVLFDGVLTLSTNHIKIVRVVPSNGIMYHNECTPNQCRWWFKTDASTVPKNDSYITIYYRQDPGYYLQQKDVQATAISTIPGYETVSLNASNVISNIINNYTP